MSSAPAPPARRRFRNGCSPCDLFDQADEPTHEPVVARLFQWILHKNGVPALEGAVQGCALRCVEGLGNALKQPRRSLNPKQAPCNPGVLVLSRSVCSLAPKQARRSEEHTSELQSPC